MRRRLIKNLQTVLMIGFLMSGAAHILMTIESVPVAFFFRSCHEVGDGLVLLALFYGIPKLFKVESIGGCAAFVSLWMSIGSFVSMILFGYIGDEWGNQWPLIISGAVLALLPLLILLRRRYVQSVI